VVRGVVLGVLLAFIACTVPALALSLDDAKAVLRLTDPADPPPAFNEGDYDKFVRPGTGSVVAQMATLLKNGRAIFAEYGDAVYLYPLTPYTDWILRRWTLTEVAGHAWNEQPTYPGENFPHDAYPSHLQVPSILIPLSLAAEPHPTAVRYEELEQGRNAPGVVVFRNVPPGQYVVVARTPVEWLAGETVANEIAYEPGPDGMIEPDPSSLRVHDEEHVARDGGFVVVSFASVENGRTTYAPATNCQVVAHYV
jgi:hypothetical protein